MEQMFFDDWGGLARTVIIGALAYVALVVALRLSGKRTLSKMNAFDFIVTIALGSTLATVLLSKDVALAEGVLAFALLIALQFAVTWASVRNERIQSLVSGRALMLVERGVMLRSAMRHARITEEDIHAAARGAGVGDLAEVHAMVLETDASLTVVLRGREGDGSALAAVRRVPG